MIPLRLLLSTGRCSTGPRFPERIWHVSHHRQNRPDPDRCRRGHARVPLVPATAAPVDETAEGVVVAKGGLIGHLRPSTHAPANHIFPNGSEVTLDSKVSGTVVDGNPRWYLVVAEGDANWVSARYLRNVGPAPEPCDPSDGTFSAKTTAVLKKRVGPTTADASAGTYAKGQKFRVQCYTDSWQKWYLTDTSRWLRAKHVTTSSKVRYCSNL
jgi:hypothetical protein